MIGEVLSIFEFIKGLFPKIIEYWRQRDFSAFFGKDSIKAGNFWIITDVFYDSRPPGPRYLKGFPGNQHVVIIGPHGLMGSYMARTIYYLTSFLSAYCKFPIKIERDEVAHVEWEGTFLALGSSASNIKSKQILEKIENTFVDFAIANNVPVIIDKKTATAYSLTVSPQVDYGLILKLDNNLYKNNSLIVCAGLGEFGTSGASYYLSRHWEDLYKKYKKKPFGVIVKVSDGSDASSVPVAFIG